MRARELFPATVVGELQARLAPYARARARRTGPRNVMPPKRAAAASTSKGSRSSPPRLRSPSTTWCNCRHRRRFLGRRAARHRLVGRCARWATPTHALGQIVDVDDRLDPLFVGPTGESLLPVMREQLVATPAVRARDRFRAAASRRSPPPRSPPPRRPPQLRRRVAVARRRRRCRRVGRARLPSPPVAPRAWSVGAQQATAQDGMHPMQPPRSKRPRRRPPLPLRRPSSATAATPSTAPSPSSEGLASTAGRWPPTRRRGRRGTHDAAAGAGGARGDGGGGSTGCTRIRRRRSTRCWAVVT